MKNILFVVGSFRLQSFNRQLALRIAGDLSDSANCTFLEFRDIPYMDQDIEFPAPEAVQRVRDRVRAAGALWIVTPEYNASYPGLLKNLVDWLSRPLQPGGPRASAVITGKKCAVTSVGGGAKGENCIRNLIPLLSFVGADPMKSPALGIGYTRKEVDSNVLEMTAERMKLVSEQEEAFLRFLAT